METATVGLFVTVLKWTLINGPFIFGQGSVLDTNSTFITGAKIDFVSGRDILGSCAFARIWTRIGGWRKMG